MVNDGRAAPLRTLRSRAAGAIGEQGERIDNKDVA